MNWYLQALRKYAVFRGRSRRKEYWLFTLFNVIILLVLMLIGSAVGLDEETRAVPIVLYSVAVLMPSIAVTVRRLHDTGRSAWWLLIELIPTIGPIILLVFMILDSQPGENQYGPNPKMLMPQPPNNSFNRSAR